MAHLEAEVERAVVVDDVVRAAVADLVALPDVARVAVALTEGGGRRLRFCSVRRGEGPPTGLDWCHIDAYDDVPLNDVVRTGRPILAALTTLVTGVAVIVGILALVVDRALAQTEDLQKAASQALADVEQALIRSSLPVTEGRLTDLEDRVREGLPSLLPGPAAAATGAVQVLGGIALALFVWFFLLRDGPRWWQWAMRWVPSQRREAVAEGGDAAWDVLTRYVRGTVVVATIDAVGVAVALLVLGVPMVTSLACLVFLGAFVPIVGSTVAGTLAVAVALVSQGPLVALLVVLAVIAVQQVEGNLLQPLVMGRALHLHPAAVVVAVALGASAAGVIGAVVAVPVVAVATRLAEQVRDRPA